MKTAVKMRVKKIFFGAIIVMCTFLLVVISCVKDVNSTNEISYCGTPITSVFLAGQNYDAGLVLVGNDKKFLYVTYNTSNGWIIKKTHLYVGTETNFPKSASPELFPYKTDHGIGVTSYTYTIPLSILKTCVVISAHAEVEQIDADGKTIQSQTAWCSGVNCGDNGDSWAMKFGYCRQKCVGGGVVNPISDEEDENCYGISKTAWGAGDPYNENDSNDLATYSTYIPNTPLIIYAGEYEVGTLTFIEMDNATVKIIINLVGWGFQEVSEPIKIQGYNSNVPKINPSPGQFKTYKGTSLFITLPKYTYYGVHLSLREIIPCED